MLTEEQLAELKKFDSPTICNAIEFFSVRPKTSGFMNTDIKKVFHNSARTVGYACTARISALHPPTEEQKKLADTYYGTLHASPKPTITVIQDLDPVPTGSFWGEVQATTHAALGCAGVVTSGGVRDLDEVEPLGFEYYAARILVSHAYIHLVEVGGPVDVGGLAVSPGELVFADKHGVVVIPDAIAPHLAEACRAAAAAEAPVLTNCRRYFGGLVEMESLTKWRAEMNRLRSEAAEEFTARLKKG
ncbi:MAG: RraA family protein [Spirochaetales bacterium]|jgi:regulator of RNase E activity RraA|nr:RraA family protein [Spirochaetales bacterium]